LENHDSQYSVEPFFFGEASKELFGCYHRPNRLAARNCGIVLCYPIGQEYIMSHRSFYQLAVQLSRIGFHVLRFDYFGCGDSAGDFEQGSVRKWVSDIQAAARALADRSKQSRISALGLRMGATLALMASEQNEIFGKLVLWEPILDGRRYLKELTEMHQAFSRRLKTKEKRVPGMPEEVLGYPLTTELRNDLKAIQGDHLNLRSDMRLLAVCSSTDGACSKELKRLLRAHPQAEEHMISDHLVWREELYKRLIPVTTMNLILKWMDGAHQ
jgi:uncharacterized protein